MEAGIWEEVSERYILETHRLMLSTWKIARKMLACYLTSASNSQGVQGLNLGEQMEEKAHPKKIIWPKK